MKKYHIITFGCQMNEHDSENLAGMCESLGYEHLDDPFMADLVIMNTCSVRDNADKRFFGMLGQFKNRKRYDKDFIICVCGCMPQQKWVIDQIKNSYSWVDVIFGTQTIDEFKELLTKRIETGKKQISIVDSSDKVPDETGAIRKSRHRALVNVTYGCNNFCTYCIVPYTRGREKSRSLFSVTEEIEMLVADGAVEVMLLGQNVNSYRDREGNGFTELLRAVNDIDGLERIRFMTSHPKDVNDEFIKAFAELDKVCKQVHMPVQAGSDAILERMHRRYTQAEYLEKVRKFREACPGLAISTDIMVGFPGESEADFEETLKVVEEVKYDSAFTFIYSPREGTPAAGYPDQIPEEVKHERFDRLTDMVNRYALEANRKYEGNIYEILVDGKSKKDDSVYTGRTDTFKLVNFRASRDLIGEKVMVRIDDSKTFSLEGTLV